MTSNIGIAGLIAKSDDSVLKGVHRSRLSLHLKTPHVRHWLLVQFVSMPVPIEEEQEDKVGKAVRSAQRQEKLRCGVDKIRDEYRMARPVNIWA